MVYWRTYSCFMMTWWEGAEICCDLLNWFRSQISCCIKSSDLLEGSSIRCDQRAKLFLYWSFRILLGLGKSEDQSEDLQVSLFGPHRHSFLFGWWYPDASPPASFLGVGWVGLTVPGPVLNTFVRPVGNHYSPLELTGQLRMGTEPRATSWGAIAFLLELLGCLQHKRARLRFRAVASPPLLLSVGHSESQTSLDSRIGEIGFTSLWEEQHFICEAEKSWGHFFSLLHLLWLTFCSKCVWYAWGYLICAIVLLGSYSTNVIAVIIIPIAHGVWRGLGSQSLRWAWGRRGYSRSSIIIAESCTLLNCDIF